MQPTIALVGRPNVGKSTLFNTLTKSRQALVADYNALTRDRQYGSGLDNKFTLIDTPGVISKAKDIEKHAQLQTIAAIEEADIILFIINAQEDLVAQDYDIADNLRRYSAKVYVILNKIDGVNINNINSDIYKFGWPIHAISALNSRGIDKLLQKILPAQQEENTQTSEHIEVQTDKKIDKTIDRQKDSYINNQEDRETYPNTEKNIAIAKNSNTEKDKYISCKTKIDTIKIAIVGRPNVGKSTLINKLIGDNRLLTYDQPGTTRDSISVPYTYNKQDYTLIDTAGIRKRKKSTDIIEEFSIQKSLTSIEESHITILVIDALDGLVEQDLNLIHLITTHKHALVIAINKSDHLNNAQKKAMQDEIQYKLRFISYINTIFICAITSYGFRKLHKFIISFYKNANKTFSTHKLTTLLIEAATKNPPPLVKGKRIKMRYAHQGGSLPLTIVVHGKQLNSLPQNYQTYLENFFYKKLFITGSPIKLVFKTDENPYVT